MLIANAAIVHVRRRPTPASRNAALQQLRARAQADALKQGNATYTFETSFGPPGTTGR